ncbi:MAG: hypothetical protein LBQ46_07580 [Treponema sp.]|nr:hypothetical protein [Treponema sp.]
MKNWIKFFPAVVLPALLSCATGAGSGSWDSYPPAPAVWDYRVGAVEVTVDHVKEDRAASQIGVIAETLLAADLPPDGENTIHTLIDIRVEQRSFLHSVELLNTIYIDCLVRDEAGQVLGRVYQYSVGKRSILSSKEQYRLLKRALRKILAARQERNRETGQYGGSHA